MSAAAEIQAGVAYINGIQGTIVMNSGAADSVTHVHNLGTRTWSKEFKMEEVSAQNGATIETIIASQQKKMLDLEFIPSGTTRANAIAEVAELTALTPLAVIKITQSNTPANADAGLKKVGGAAATYNLMAAMSVREIRDGILSVTMKLQAQQQAADGEIYEALAIVVG